MLVADFRVRQTVADLLRIPGAAGAADLAPDLLNRRDDARLFAALAAMVVECLGTGKIDFLIGDLWATRSDRLHRAPPPVRAALMNGFTVLCNLGLVGDIDPPPASSFVTHSLQPIATALIRIGRQMTAEEMDQVARADYGCDVVRHRAALQVLLDDPALSYPEGELWYPAEVIELVSHVPGKPGHVPCLAIVLLEALRGGDAQGHAAFRLEKQHDRIAALPPALCNPILAAFRHLYESDPHWSPSVPAPFTLPWVSLH